MVGAKKSLPIFSDAVSRVSLRFLLASAFTLSASIKSIPLALQYTIFKSELGWVGVLASAEGLLRATLPQGSAQKVRQLLGDALNQATPSPHLFDDLARRLKLYFSGRRVVFPDKLDLSEATPFQRQVWEVTRLIPYGETRSYRWVAEQMKRPETARAVGQALAQNPLPIIIPCHRVVASNGKLGGYSGGVEMKKYLLWLEAKGAREAPGQALLGKCFV